MVIQTYGYDWTLLIEHGSTKAISLLHVEFIRLAEKYNSEIKFDNLHNLHGSTMPMKMANDTMFGLRTPEAYRPK